MVRSRRPRTLYASRDGWQGHALQDIGDAHQVPALRRQYHIASERPRTFEGRVAVPDPADDPPGARVRLTLRNPLDDGTRNRSVLTLGSVMRSGAESR